MSPFFKTFRRLQNSLPLQIATPVVLFVGVVAMIGGVAIGVFFGPRLLRRSIPITVSQVPEINRLLEDVRAHIVINTAEDPTVATVEQAETLRRQNPLFYKDVEAGDKLIVWSDRAVLYSPQRDVVLAALVAPDTRGVNGAEAAVSSLQGMTVEIRNGSGVPGATKWLVDRLQESGYAAVATKNAEKVYETTLVVPGSEKSRTADLESFLPLSGGAIGDLPAGEKSPTTDLLIILGKDQR
jgi:hypothetical protein